MTNMEDMQTKLTEAERQQRVYDAAMASLNAEKTARERNGYVLMSSFMGYGEAATGNGIFGKVSELAKVFCIAFACAVPPLLVWIYLL
ncbi:MAG: hypothetical protein AAFY38_09295 [Pseudomonadota bacterium]